mgnify:CR=1 FL=1
MMQSRRYAFGGLLLVIALWPLVGSGQNGMSSGQWRAYSADEGSTRYSSLDQISKENVKNLQVAWTWKFDNFGGGTSDTTPIMVNGVLYFTVGPRRNVSSSKPAPAAIAYPSARPHAKCSGRCASEPVVTARPPRARNRATVSGCGNDSAIA